MKNEEEFSNIFDAASKMRPAARKKRSTHAPSQTPPTPTPALGKPVQPLTNAEIKQMIEHMQKLKEEIAQKLEELYSHSGLSPKRLKLYLDKFGGKTTAEWERAHHDLEELEAQVWTVIGPEARVIHMRKEKEKLRKRKSARARKGWFKVE